MSATHSWFHPADHQPPTQIRIDTPMVIAVCRQHETALPDAQQIVVTHQPQNPLVVDHPPVTLQEPRDSTVSAVTIHQRPPLNGIPQRQLFLLRLPFPPTAVVAGSAHRRRFAHLADC
jgi:hypothetical protein